LRGGSIAERIVARINYLLWFGRVLSWDSLVAACLLLIPVAIETLFPNAEDALFLAAAVLPLVAFLLRGIAGLRQINRNHCSRRVHRLQLVALGLGIFPLAFFDCFMILAALEPKPPRLAVPPPEGFWLVLGGIFCFYLLMMIIAMYPGRTVSGED
jgi:hypothetical protein